jgi:hypothetical protein
MVTVAAREDLAAQLPTHWPLLWRERCSIDIVDPSRLLVPLAYGLPEGRLRNKSGGQRIGGGVAQQDSAVRVEDRHGIRHRLHDGLQLRHTLTELLSSFLLPRVQTGSVDSQRHPVSDLLQQLHIARIEVPGLRGPDHDYSQQLVSNLQWHAGNCVELFTEQRNGNREGADIIHHQRLSSGGDAPGDALPHWHAHRSRQRHIELGACLHGQSLPCRVEEKYGGVVYAQHLRDPLEQGRKQVVEREVGERGIGEGLQGA